MSAFETRFTVTDTLVPGLAALRAAGGDLTRPMAEISEAMLTHTQERFEGECGPDDVPWKPSQRVTEEGGKTLYLHGYLFNAIENRFDSDSAEVGVLGSGPAAIYAAAHQFGATITPREGRRALNTPFGPRASVRIPARPFLGIEPRDRTVAEEALIAHLARAAGQEGGV